MEIGKIQTLRIIENHNRLFNEISRSVDLEINDDVYSISFGLYFELKSRTHGILNIFWGEGNERFHNYDFSEESDDFNYWGEYDPL